MNTFLLDSNILIYLFARNEHVEDFINNLCADEFVMSAVSYLEILVGAEKGGTPRTKIRTFLDEVRVIPFEKGTAETALWLSDLNRKKLKFKDLAIAATALDHELTLVTADRDFKSIKGLKVKCVKIKPATA